MIRFNTLIAAALLSSTALAEDTYQGVGDNSFGPYETNAALTQGDASGFTSLHASAESLQEGLKPAEATTAAGPQTLAIENTSLSSVTVTVNETKVGTLGPITIGRIQGIPAGSYNVVLGHPNGYNQSLTIGTHGPEGVEKTELPEEEAPEADSSESADTETPEAAE